MGSTAINPKQYLDEDGNPVTIPSGMKLPAGYSLLSSKKFDAPKKNALTLKDLKAEAEKRNPNTPPASLTPYSPSRLQQIRDVVANSAIGHSIEQSMPKLADALNLHPSETVYSPTYEQHKEQLLAPEYATGIATDIVNANSPVPLTQAGTDRLKGALTAAGGLTTVPSVVMMAAGPLAKVATPAGAMLSRLVSGAFTLDMLHGLYNQSKEYRKAVDSGDMAAAHRIQGEMGVNGIMSLLSGKHALTKYPFTPVTEPPIRERTNVLHRNSAGEVRQAKGQAPSVWLNPEAWKSFMGSLYPEESAADTNGINLPANEHLHAFANDQDLAAANPSFGEVQKLLAEAHKNAGGGGVAIAKTRPSLQSNVNVMREELNHTWQRSLADGDVAGHLSPEAFADLHQSIPKGMQDHLIEQGYDGASAPEMVTETAAKLMDGRPERFGVKPEEAVDFLDNYFKQVSAQHGPKALEALQHVRGIAADAKARAITEHSGSGSGQDNSTIPSVAAGGQGGAAEGVPATGEEIGAHPEYDAMARERGPDGLTNMERARRQALNDASRPPEGFLPHTQSEIEMIEDSTGRPYDPVRDAGMFRRTYQVGDAAFSREQEQPNWYLKSERLIGDKMKGPQAAEDVHKMLVSNGVKPEEMQWTGLDDFLKSKGKEKVTPEEIREHLANNNIQIKEVQKGARTHGTPLQPEAIAQAVQTGKQLYGVDKDSGLQATEATTGLDSKGLAKYLSDNQRRFNVYSGEPTPVQLPKYSQYVLPGGQNYREMLLTMPPDSNINSITRIAGEKLKEATDAQADAKYRYEETGSEEDQKKYLDAIGARGKAEAELKQLREKEEANTYRSGHWDEPNILAHVRFNDRTGPNGERLLHVEEVQSDWHQQGRDKGYQRNRSTNEKYDLGVLRRNANDLLRMVDNLGFENSIEARNQIAAHPDWATRWDVRPLTEDQIQQIDAWRNAHNDATEATYGVPDAPFKKTWHEMALRRMLKYAAENGYDGVSWTPGADQNERYSLSHQVDKIAVPMVNKDGSRSVRIDPIGGGHNSFKLMVSPDGTVDGSHNASQFSGKKLDDVVGKEMASKIMEAKEPTDFEGKGLDVGGSGMKGFYDKIVPDYLNKFGKKFGAKVGETQINAGKNLSSNTVEKIKSQVKNDARLGIMDLYAHINPEDDYYYINGKNEADDLDSVTYKIADKNGNIVENPNNLKNVQHLPITPEMRKSVTEEGVPLFNRERRVDGATRKRVEEMTPEEMRKALLTSDKTDLPNRRAFDDAEHAKASPAVAMSDADGLKALNDKFGYAAGDELLKAKADALREAGLDAYHDKGDEFLYRGTSPQDLKDKLDKAREILRNRVFEVILKDGKKLYFKGADFSYGTGKNLDESENGLKEHKETREKAGERVRGELRGIAETQP